MIFKRLSNGDVFCYKITVQLSDINYVMLSSECFAYTGPYTGGEFVNEAQRKSKY